LGSCGLGSCGVETYQAIMTRRSVPKTSEPAPDRVTLQKLLDAAVRAPSHHLTQPWRFIVLTGPALKELGDVWAKAAEREGKDGDSVRDKPLRAPVIITFVGRPHGDNPRVVEVEEYHAIGAAIQNILLAAHDMGFGAMIRTGPAAALPEVLNYLGVEESEYVAGFIYIGVPPVNDSERPMSRRRPASEITEWRGFS
jgi:nitroreductase